MSSRPPYSVLLDIIKVLSQCFQRTYIVLDALDEIKPDDRDLLMRTLGEICLLNVNLLVTSRRESYIVDGFNGLFLEEIGLQSSKIDADIKLYVSESVKKEPRFSTWSSELREEVEQTLAKKAKGMFRWVECQMEVLKKSRRPYDVKQALSSLPKTLDETYKRILLAIPEEDRVYAARLFAWIIHSQSPLCLELLAEAIVIDLDPDSLLCNSPDSHLHDPAQTLDICSCLFTTSIPLCFFRVEKERCPGHINLRFAHYSVQEYFCSERFKSDFKSDCLLFVRWKR
ncbi:hypothetical protein M422DRAFT_195819 [Sphaerobolus stellatus SS14]|uniref:Nephrocystin 3-like N-terminal domain-containing protein n=1 Tax=Sphaerobolus stellatus (strain SS14) TaxID=990650 RepID=A0A0C9TNR1_SPHS4|nr:hypothetical protein M422DRAFT_195819 [Sphaerobolus stellatus SS14]